MLPDLAGSRRTRELRQYHFSCASWRCSASWRPCSRRCPQATSHGRRCWGSSVKAYGVFYGMLQLFHKHAHVLHSCLQLFLLSTRSCPLSCLVSLSALRVSLCGVCVWGVGSSLCTCMDEHVFSCVGLLFLACLLASMAARLCMYICPSDNWPVTCTP